MPTAYPKNLAEVIELCRTRRPNEFLHAAGSHYALSGAALSDTTFIETHDPNLHPYDTVYHQAMGQTLQGVIPECMNGAYLDKLALDDSYPYLAHIQAESAYISSMRSWMTSSHSLTRSRETRPKRR